MQHEDEPDHPDPSTCQATAGLTRHPPKERGSECNFGGGPAPFRGSWTRSTHMKTHGGKMPIVGITAKGNRMIGNHARNVGAATAIL
jgi:hypothetical protein